MIWWYREHEHTICGWQSFYSMSASKAHILAAMKLNILHKHVCFLGKTKEQKNMPLQRDPFQ